MPIPPQSSLTYYPAYCFAASPTYNVWVKLTAAGLHRLRARQGFEGQNLYFHLNHPIQWIQITGIVVGLEPNDWYWIFYVDDGSGMLLEVVLPRPKAVNVPFAKPKELITPVAPSHFGISASGNNISLEHFDVGSLVKVKGGIREFRGEKQLSLERLMIVEDTAAEVKYWEDLHSFYTTVLSRPWNLTESEQRKLREDERRAARSLQEKEERKRAREQKRQEKEARRVEREQGRNRNRNSKLGDQGTKKYPGARASQSKA